MAAGGVWGYVGALHSAGVDDTPAARRAYDLVFASCGGSEPMAMSAMGMICREARKPVFGPRVLDHLRSMCRSNLSREDVERVQDLCGLRALREAHALKARRREQRRVSALKGAVHGCRRVHQSLETLEPPLPVPMRRLLEAKRTLLKEATRPQTAQVLFEFLYAVDGCLAVSRAARQLYGRFVYSLWADAHTAWEGPCDEKYFDGENEDEEEEDEEEDEDGEDDAHSFGEGDRVRVGGLRSQPQHNGCLGTVVGTQQAAGRVARFQVRMDSGVEMALQTKSLSLVLKARRIAKAVARCVAFARIMEARRTDQGESRVAMPAGFESPLTHATVRGEYPWDQTGPSQLPRRRGRANDEEGLVVQHSLNTADVPPELVCPITLSVFTEPVLLVGDGMTYERKSIQAWLKLNQRSPVTNRALEDLTLVPNRLVYSMLHRLSTGE